MNRRTFLRGVLSLPIIAAIPKWVQSAPQKQFKAVWNPRWRKVYYLDPKATGKGDGSSWENAFTSFNDTIVNAQLGRGTIVYCRESIELNQSTQPQIIDVKWTTFDWGENKLHA
jgi:hypothetical protein